MKKIILLLLCSCMGLFVYAQQYTRSEKIMIARLTWLYKVKAFAAKQSWPEFAGRNNEIALAYFTDSSSYFIDPGTVLQQRIAAVPFYRADNRTILKTLKRIDDLPFHMETSMETTDSTALYFNYPVMMCSAYESTRKQIPDLSNLQEWAAMVVHEYFHGFQFRHPALIAYSNDSVTLSGSQVQAFYDQYEWFKTSIDQENNLLLDCLELKEQKAIDSTLALFCLLREKRRQRLEDSLHNGLARQEDFYEKLEGSAKYVDLNLLAAYKHFPPDQQLQQLDSAYQRDAYRHLDLKQEKWMYSPGFVSYFYATGCNLLRVLDKLRLPYKKDFFDHNYKTPYGLIKAYIFSKKQ